MPMITVVVESTFSGPASGFHGITIDDSKPVKELISQFCNAKSTYEDPNYTLITKNNVMLVNRQPISNFFLQDGEVLRLIMNKNNSKLLFRQWLTMAVIGMFVGIVGLTICVLLYAVFRNVPDNYALVIDAGSTHTDMILYSWPGTKRNNTGEVTQVFMCDAPGGIAQIAPENISQYFDSCFDQSYNSVKEDSRKNAEVLFGATAGMRILNQTDPVATAEIIDGVRSYLKQSEWKFKDPNVGIIAGFTEGVSGWITINFLEKTVLKKGSVNDTFGAMDLGGASTQISFEVPDTMKSADNVYPITLFGNKYYIFSQSFLCHGVVQALRRYRTILKIEQAVLNQNTNNLTSPCEPVGRIYKTSDDYFDSVCVKSAVPESDRKKSWNMFGTGNYTECQRVVDKMLNFSECNKAKLGNCIDPSQIPPEVVHRKFYAFAAYNYITQDLGIPKSASLSEAQRYIKVMCEYSIKELEVVKSKSKNSKRKFELLCFEGEYMLSLLTEVYGFSSEPEWSQITFTNEVKETSLGWTLGYIVNATEEIAAAPPVPKLKVLPFSLLTILFVIFVLLSIWFSIHGFKVRKNSPGYQRRLVLSMDRELEKFIQPNNEFDYD